MAGGTKHGAGVSRGSGVRREGPSDHWQEPPPGEPPGQQEVHLPPLQRGLQHGGGPAQYVGHVLHHPEDHGGRCLCLLW